MSSSELLDLLDFLPDEAATKTAERAGDWHAEQYRQARIINELACMRYEHAGGHKPSLEMSPAQLWLKREKDDWRAERHAAVSAQLHKRKGGD
jgi:hypothetical protein